MNMEKPQNNKSLWSDSRLNEKKEYCMCACVWSEQLLYGPSTSPKKNDMKDLKNVAVLSPLSAAWNEEQLTGGFHVHRGGM